MSEIMEGGKRNAITEEKMNLGAVAENEMFGCFQLTVWDEVGSKSKSKQLKPG